MKVSRVSGTTSEILQIFIRDSSSTTGAGLANLVFNSASLTAYYCRNDQGAATVITLVTMTAGTFTSSGFVAIDNTNMPGWYQFCPPNAVFTSGRSAAIHLKGATNMAPLPIEVEVTAVNNQDGVRFGMTALPNAAAAAANGLMINGANTGAVTLAGLTTGALATSAITTTGTHTITDGLVVNRSTANSSAIAATGNGTGNGIVATSGAGATGDGIQATAGSTNGNGLALTKSGTGLALKGASTDLTLAKTTNITGFNDLTASAIATGVWTDATASDFTAVLSVGKSVMNGVALGTGLTINAYTGDTPQTGDAFLRIGANGVSLSAIPDMAGTTTLLARVTAVRAGYFDNLSAGAVALASGVTVTTNNDKTGYVLSATGSAALTEGYAADGSTATLNQLLYMIWSLLAERNASGTTLTTKKIDGITNSMTFTLDAASPSTQTRTT